ncbi:MAG: NAD(+) diphosphatase [Actinomycetota bacterium]
MTEPILPPLARSALERDYQLRSNPELFDLLWAENNTRVLAMHEGKVLLKPGATIPKLALMPVEAVPTATLRVFLGRTVDSEEAISSGSAIVLAVLSENGAREIEPESSAWQSLRSIGGVLGDFDAGLFTQALALANWHLKHTHCPNCGTPTVIEQGGWVRRCFKDSMEWFPRIDPAIIVSILDQQDRLLLGSQASWPENQWSILAGFVEPGESLEAAVIREMHEETGLRVSNPEYIFSQAWPYPLSLMLGFKARANSEDQLLPDGEEIVRLRWFSKAELESEAAKILLPPRSSISRAMIELWYGSKILSARESGNNGDQ